MIALYIATAVALLVSLAASRQKTLAVVKLAGKRFTRILPGFLVMLILFAVTISLVPDETLQRVLGKESGALGVALAALFGSITLMPGFIAFPLSGALLSQGVPYMVLAAFTNSIMMVGVLTYPLETQYFGTRVTIVRNAVSLVIALIVAVATGLVFGEIGL